MLVAGVLVGAAVHYLVARPLRRLAVGLAQLAQEVTAAAGSVGAGSLTLARGASQQAASLEETSAALAEMSRLAQQNTTTIAQANSAPATGRNLFWDALRFTGATDNLWMHWLGRPGKITLKAIPSAPI